MKGLGKAASTGLLFGIGGVYLGLVGLLEMLHEIPIVMGNVATLAEATLLLLGLGAGASAIRLRTDWSGDLARGLVAGLVTGLFLAALELAVALLSLRAVFIAASPALAHLLSFGLAPTPGAIVLLVAGGIAGLAGAALARAPADFRRPVVSGALAVVIAGVFQQLFQLVLQYGGAIAAIRDLLYTWQGMRPIGAAVIFVVVAGASVLTSILKRRRGTSELTPELRRRQRFITASAVVVVLAILPLLAGAYIGQVLMMVGLYMLMGMGLNLEVGLAGLLDLGFVAFFAVGAYATALLTSGSGVGLVHLTYWEAMPLAVLISVCGGILFGVPVLGIRGDYLALATLGLGEIVRILVLSDFAAPLLGGPTGVLDIPKPRLGGFELGSPVRLFYLTLIATAIAAFIAFRLENSRLGRAWTALRDDEDVAQALGISLIRSKLLAYGLGAAFGGLAGSIFASMLGSVFPSSFELLISINVLAIVIIGGMASLPGVMVGAIVLVGLPELLQQFGPYRFLFYGAALIVMMRWRPEGLWPSEIRAREMHAMAAEAEPAVLADERP